MKLYTPKYYRNFKCIADKCEHSCCIGWEIDIDADTLKKYQGLNGGYGEVIKSSISLDGDPHFKLGAHDRCPHLNERGLCNIILNLGEDHICSICREHPRFYNFTSVAEVGIGMSCPEAARVILASPDYYVFDEIGEMAANTDDVCFDGSAERGRVFDILRDTGASYRSRLEVIREVYGITQEVDGFWLSKIDSLEYLNGDHKKLFMKYSKDNRPEGNDEYLERALAYFIYRHCTEVIDSADFCALLKFSMFCEGLLASLICTENAASLSEAAALASIISEEIEYSDDNTFILTC